MDYYSHYIELAKLTSATSTAVIKHLKSIFARHGLPQIVVSNNGPQYSSSVFTDFAKQYDFTHITSSPQFPQANGAAERAVSTVKTLLTKSDDPHMAMLAHRSTLLEDGYSPGSFGFMSRVVVGTRVRNCLPIKSWAAEGSPDQTKAEKKL